MRRLIFIFLILLSIPVGSYAQKSRVIAAFQLIETERYKEAKKAIEDAVEDEKTSDWFRTWHARGLLSQTAYQDGRKEKDKEKYELYPDQLYVAWISYEKALTLDKRGRLDEQLEPMYIMLVNDFRKLGENLYQKDQYKDALKAFEHALKVSQSPILSVEPDSNLIFNTALAAYESEEWEKAIEYLGQLNQGKYSTNVPYLLYSLYLEKEDTASAEEVLYEGVSRYEYDQELLLLLADLLYMNNKLEQAVILLDSASINKPEDYIFPFTKGLIYQKDEQYDKAIDAYKNAIDIASDQTIIYRNIATCYYNIGVEIDKNARTIRNNQAYRREKIRSAEAFRSAVTWFEKVLEKDPENQQVINKLHQLYRFLGTAEKIQELENFK